MSLDVIKWECILYMFRYDFCYNGGLFDNFKVFIFL